MARLAYPALLALTFAGAGCAPAETVSNAETEVAAFHRLYDQSQFESIYYATSDRLRAPGENGRFLRFLQVARERLGPVVSTGQVGWNAHSGLGVTTTTLTYETRFLHGSGTEIFAYELVDGRQQLLNYTLNSNELTDAMIDATAAKQLDDAEAARQAQGNSSVAGPASARR